MSYMLLPVKICIYINSKNLADSTCLTSVPSIFILTGCIVYCFVLFFENNELSFYIEGEFIGS